MTLETLGLGEKKWVRQGDLDLQKNCAEHRNFGRKKQREDRSSSDGRGGPEFVTNKPVFCLTGDEFSRKKLGMFGAAGL